ncbi:MAG: hypothetical protein U9R58_13230 [Chloroflexota bacterium]|nr:hypothetical protein [Chloroflexota bacterium]
MKIVYNNKVHLIFTALLFSLFVGLTACQPETESDLPASAARDWLIAANGIYTQKAVALTCSDKEEELRSNRETGAARYIIISKKLRHVDVDINFDASGVEFNVVSLEPDEAVVEAKGEVRVMVGEGSYLPPFELDERWLMVLEEGEWKWCGYFIQD